jgi:predicted Zn-dependent protease
MRRVSVTVLTLILAALLSCATTGPGGKKDIIIISDSQEVGLGQQFDTQVRSESKVFADQQWQEYFNEVGQTIVDVCDRKNIEYHFTVIESDDINAFATPGGYVYIYTGLLKLMESEAELAAVTAHEVSHIVARHGVKRLQQALGLSVLLELVTGESDSKTLETAIALGLSIALSGYSRSNEREADEFGIHYMTLAGFNPQGTSSMFERLASVSPGQRNFFENMFATHPETNERISNAKAQMRQYSDEILSRDIGESRYKQMKTRLP